MLPFVKDLVHAITESGALPLILEAWAFKDGDKRFSADDTFERMQNRLIEGCKHAADATGARIIPVGSAFVGVQAHEKIHKQLQLWQHDGRHARL